MIRFKLSILAPVALLMVAPHVHAQLSKIVWVDFERAVVESVEGKKSSDKFNESLKTRQADVEKRQKELDEAQKKLQNGARTLSDAAKAALQKDIDKKTTDLQRINEDAQKELQTLRDELLRPIAERATALLNQLAEEQGYTLVIDTSSPESNVVFANPKNDITADLVKRIDASTANEPATKTEAPKATTPAGPRGTPAPPPPQKP